MKKGSDYRLDYILHKGDQIYTDHAVYTISGEPLGLGGSSILYPATKEGSELEVAIKEWFPRRPANFERRNGIIQPKDPNDIITPKENRKRFETELEMGEQIRNTTVRAIHLWGILKPTKIILNGKAEDSCDVANGLFAVMERMDQKGKSFNQLLRYISENPSDDHPLKTGGLPNIHTTALIMEQVLFALQRVHEAGENGYIFGDIQDGNIYFADCRLEQGDIGTGMLLDFGCTKPLSLIKGRKVYEYQGENIFSSQGYIPPEIADPHTNEWLLTEKADIYSAGCLMLRCLLSRYKINTLGGTPYYKDDLVDEVDASDIGCSESNRRLVNSILKNAMRLNPKDRPSVDEMLAEIQKLKRDTAPPIYLLSANLSAPECYDLVLESRREDMCRIEKSITQKQPVFIWGFPGLGKTELSIAFARTYNPDKSYLVRYKETMRDTIIDLQFTDMDDPDLRNLSKDERALAEEKIYKRKLDELKKYPSSSILIIDNFDSKTKTFQEMVQEPAYLDLLGINMHILITTRSQPDDVTPEIQPLKAEYLLKLMKRFIGSRNVSDNILLQLLDACGYHTLSAELIGKAIGNKLKPVSPEYILQKLQRNQLKRAVLPKSRTSKDRVFDEDTIYGHLKTLFDIACLSEVEQEIMCDAALLPTGGVDASIFLRAEYMEFNHSESVKKHQAIEQLVLKGWLHISQDRIISLHPLISDLVNEELGITYEKSKCFLHSLFDGAVNDQLYRISTASSRSWSTSSESPFTSGGPFDYRGLLVEHFGYRDYSNPTEEFKDCIRLLNMIGEVFANAAYRIPTSRIFYASDAAFCFHESGNHDMCLQYSHLALDGLIQKTLENPDWDCQKHNIFTVAEKRAVSTIRQIWCPELSERLWDIEYAELYGNELFMDHSKKPIQIQNIYSKLRYLLTAKT